MEIVCRQARLHPSLLSIKWLRVHLPPGWDVSHCSVTWAPSSNFAGTHLHIVTQVHVERSAMRVKCLTQNLNAEPTVLPLCFFFLLALHILRFYKLYSLIKRAQMSLKSSIVFSIEISQFFCCAILFFFLKKPKCTVYLSLLWLMNNAIQTGCSLRFKKFI